MNEIVWLSSFEFSSLAKIKERRARNAFTRTFSGHTWRNHNLIVRRLRGRGGNGGWCYEVRLDSLPAELQLQYIPLTPFETGFKPALNDPSNWRYAIIEPALKYPLGSRQRAQIIKEVAAKSHFKLDGSRRQVTDRTLRNWIKEYETKGHAGLSKTVRADKNKRKVLITREWDKSIKLSLETKQEISKKIEKFIRSLWAGLQPGSGWKEVQRAASLKLLQITIEEDPDMPAIKIRNYCWLSRNAVERWRNFEAVAVHDMDAKTYFDREPRIARGTTTMLPMQIVMGDVHPIDILYLREDKSTATAKGIF